MNKKAIRNTAICYWSDEDECFVVESPLFETIAGVGLTKNDSMQVFENLLDDAYEDYLEGRVPGYDKPGRPAKGQVALNADVKPETKQLIKSLAKSFDCSQGEVLDYLAFAYEKHQKATADPGAAEKANLLNLSNQLRALNILVEQIQAELSSKVVKVGKSRYDKRTPAQTISRKRA